MTQDELKVVLEFVESINLGSRSASVEQQRKAITAINEALAQPEQEPVAWVSEDVCKGQYIDGRPRKIWWECEKGVGTAFYTTPPQRAEPVIDKSAAIRIATTLGWTPPRTWVGLTDEEVSEVFGGDIHAEHSGELRFVRAIEAKLKQKNGYTEEKNT